MAYNKYNLFVLGMAFVATPIPSAHAAGPNRAPAIEQMVEPHGHEPDSVALKLAAAEFAEADEKAGALLAERDAINDLSLPMSEEERAERRHALHTNEAMDALDEDIRKRANEILADASAGREVPAELAESMNRVNNGELKDQVIRGVSSVLVLDEGRHTASVSREKAPSINSSNSATYAPKRSPAMEPSEEVGEKRASLSNN